MATASVTVGPDRGKVYKILESDNALSIIKVFSCPFHIASRSHSTTSSPHQCKYGETLVIRGCIWRTQLLRPTTRLWKDWRWRPSTILRGQSRKPADRLEQAFSPRCGDLSANTCHQETSSRLARQRGKSASSQHAFLSSTGLLAPESLPLPGLSWLFPVASVFPCSSGSPVCSLPRPVLWCTSSLERPSR